MNERLKEIEMRFAEIRAELDNENADVDALEKEINELTEERAAILAKAEKRAALEKEVIARGVPMDVVNKELRKEEPQMPADIRDTAEYRSGFLKTLQGNPLTEAEQRAMTTVNSPGAIPTQTAHEIVKKMLEVAPLLTEITLFHVAGALSIGTDLERDSAHIHAPGVEITASSDTIAQVTLGGYEFFKLIPISKSMKSMSVDEFESWLVEMLYEDVALQIENSIINGTGTNQPSGIESITWTASVNLISTTASISYDDVCNLMTMPVKGLRKGAKFLCNSTFVYQQLAQIKDNNKRPIFVQSMVEGVADRLMGKEVLVSDECADDTLYFGQMKKIYGNLPSDVDVENSEHSSFRKGLIDYRGGAVFDCKVTAPRAFGKFKKN